MLCFIERAHYCQQQRSHYALPSSTKESISIQNRKNKSLRLLIRLEATYGAESWTLNEEIAKWLDALERKRLRPMLGEIKVNENLGNVCNKELKQLFGDLYTLSYARISYFK